MTEAKEYRGLHREDEVGSLRHSDEDCLTSERINNRMYDHMQQRKREAWPRGRTGY